jgi:hypothetical protein
MCTKMEVLWTQTGLFLKPDLCHNPHRFIASRNCLLRYPTTRLGKLMRASSIQVKGQFHECLHQQNVISDVPGYLLAITFVLEWLINSNV